MDVTTLVVTEAIGGFSVGALIGYASKVVLKITAIGLGFFFLILLWLSSNNLVIVNWPAIQAWLANTLTNLFGQNLSGSLSLGVLGTAGVGGFFYGLGKHEVLMQSRYRFNRPRFNKSRLARMNRITQLGELSNRIRLGVRRELNNKLRRGH
jgi:uncharacterized membrane protein (Fun14 family)